MKDESLTHPTSLLPAPFVRTLYERMLLTRLVDTYVFDLYKEEHTPTFASCRGYEAAQVGSAACIEIGQDFTLPYSRDLGVFLTLGMTPYEVFCIHLTLQDVQPTSQQYTHWKYHKHNTVTGSAPVATQILHAAGIAFASKLRKVPVVTIAYCGDDVVSEPDFLEGVRFSAQHRLPIIFICEHTCQKTLTTSCLAADTLPEAVTHQSLHGVDVLTIYQAMQGAMRHTREGHGPVLLELFIPHIQPSSPYTNEQDPLVSCIHTLKAQGGWDEEWATQLATRLRTEVEQAMRDARLDTQRKELAPFSPIQ